MPSSLCTMIEPLHARRTRQPLRHGLLVLALAFVAAALIAACGTSGRALRDPAPGATAPPRKTTSTTVGNKATIKPDNPFLGPLGFSLFSPVWASDGAIAAQFGCHGADTSPPLTITGVPSGTAELLLVAADVANPSAPRWIVAGINANTKKIDQGSIPPNAFEVTNATGSTQWAGPCPDAGATTTFELRLYALSQPSGLNADSGPAALAPVIATATQAPVLRGTSSN